MRSCELCKAVARMYCDSDQASLCWDCDAKVHSANFLVARHSRSLLCHVCQCPTAWNASGAKLGPTVSVCLSCVNNSGGLKEGDKEEESEERRDEVVDTEDEYDDDESEDDDESDEHDDGDEEKFVGDDEDGENQVVPLSLTPPPPEASSSSSGESSSRFANRDGDSSLKRLHENVADLPSDDDLGLSSYAQNHRLAKSSAAAHRRVDQETAFFDSLAIRQLKSRRIEASWSATAQNGPFVSRSAAIVESLRSSHEQGTNAADNASEAVVELCKLSRNPSAIDVVGLSPPSRWTSGSTFSD